MSQEPDINAALTQLDQRIERLRALAPNATPPPPPSAPPRPGLGTRWGRGLVISIFLLGCYVVVGLLMSPAVLLFHALGLTALAYVAVIAVAPLAVYSVVRGLVFEFRHWWEEDPPATARHSSAVDAHDPPGTIGGTNSPRSSPAS